MPVPQAGDILIRAIGSNRFDLIDAVSFKTIAGPVRGFAVAADVARARGARAVWQQHLDALGRPLGDPFLVRDLE